MNIQYRINKDELYKVLIRNVSQNRNKKLELILYKILWIAAITELTVILIAGIKNINISAIMQLSIIMGVGIITLPYTTKLNGILIKRLITSSYKHEFKYACDKDIYILLDENKIIIKRNGNELIDSLESIKMTESDGYIYLKLYSIMLYIPERAFNTDDERNGFISIIKESGYGNKI